jgi:hypothetical protein
LPDIKNRYKVLVSGIKKSWNNYSKTDAILEYELGTFLKIEGDTTDFQEPRTSNIQYK